MDVGGLRESYDQAALDERDLADDPILQFERWFRDALKAGTREPNAMVLATASAAGAPSARVVLLKGFDARGFVFYSNHDSQKGRELADNPRAALVFHWQELERQVRVVGAVERVTREEAAAYFQSRPRASQLGAWASRQSAVLPDRAAIERAYDEVAARFGSGDIALPPFWGGYRVAPDELEFWQGRPSRLHDRFRYRAGPSGYLRERLSP